MAAGSLCKVSAGLMQIGCHYYFLSPNDHHYARTLIEFHLLPTFEPEWNNYHLSVFIKIHARMFILGASFKNNKNILWIQSAQDTTQPQFNTSSLITCEGY